MAFRSEKICSDKFPFYSLCLELIIVFISIVIYLLLFTTGIHGGKQHTTFIFCVMSDKRYLIVIFHHR